MRSNLCAFLAVLLSFSASVSAATLTPLGDLPGGDFRSVATGVSADGSTVVGYSGLGAGQQAFRWTRGGGMVGLGDLPGGTFESSAKAVSADGSVVVGWGTWGASGLGREAFRWTSGGGMVGLGDLPGGVFYSEAGGVSADGSVVVGTGRSASGYEAYRWTNAGGIVGLGVLPVGGVDSAAFGVSADGSVVVGWGRSDSGGLGLVLEASRWTSGGGMVGLGDLPGGFESFAYDVSGDGAVVVGYAGGAVAFLWTSDGGMKRLWDVLLAQGIDPAADGWTNLTAANGISGDGNTIVGFGTRNGNTEAFVAFIPEPSSRALLGLGGALLLRRRLWRQPASHCPCGSPSSVRAS
jgi:probable HAF family extracellular repeat protein